MAGSSQLRSDGLVVLVPMVADVDPPADPDLSHVSAPHKHRRILDLPLGLDVVEELGEPESPARTSDDAAVEADRHHLRALPRALTSKKIAALLSD